MVKAPCDITLRPALPVQEPGKRGSPGTNTVNKGNDVQRLLMSQMLYIIAKLCPTLLRPHGVAHQAPLSTGFPRQESWSGLPFPPPGGSSRPSDWTCTSSTGRRILYPWAASEAQWVKQGKINNSREHDAVVLRYPLRRPLIRTWRHQVSEDDRKCRKHAGIKHLCIEKMCCGGSDADCGGPQTGLEPWSAHRQACAPRRNLNLSEHQLAWLVKTE